jgi:hypothetical protein
MASRAALRVVRASRRVAFHDIASDGDATVIAGRTGISDGVNECCRRITGR